MNMILQQQMRSPPGALTASTNGYKRTAVRHNRAKATVLIMDSRNPLVPLATAVFHEPRDAAEWMEHFLAEQPGSTIVMLDATGITVSATAAIPEHQKLAAQMAEAMWHGAAPIPRNKTKPPVEQTDFFYGPFPEQTQPTHRPQESTNAANTV